MLDAVEARVPGAGIGWDNDLGGVQIDNGDGGRTRITPTSVMTGAAWENDAGLTQHGMVGVSQDGIMGHYGRQMADGGKSGVGVVVNGNGAGVAGNHEWANGRKVGVNGSFSYDGNVSTDVTVADRDDPISQLIDPTAIDGVRSDTIPGTGSSGYHLDGRALSWSIGASAGAKYIEADAGYNASSQFNVFTEAGAVAPDEAHAQNQAILENAGGIADLGMFQDRDNPFGPLGVGQGVNWQSQNGWNAGVKGSYGAFGLRAGISRAEGHAVTMQRTGQDTMQMSVKESDMRGSSISPEIGGIALNMASSLTEAETLTFDIDAREMTPESQEQLSQFLETGLLPGANRLSGDDATAANTTFTESRARIDDIDTRLAAIDMDYSSATDAERFEYEQARQELIQERLDTGARMDESIATLNAEWRTQNEGQRDIGIPGVTINRDEHSTTQGFQGDLAGVKGLGMESATTWTEAAYLQANGDMGTEFRYRDESGGNWFNNPKFDESAANTEGTWQMGSQLDIRRGSTEAGIADSIAINSLPEYLQDAARDGSLPWGSMEQAQVVMSLDDPTLMALGADMSEGQAGEDRWASMSARTAALMNVAESFTAEGGGDRLGHGARAINDEWRAQGLIGDYENYGVNTTQAMGMAAQQLADGGMMTMGGNSFARVPEGMTPGQVATVFSEIDGPEAFTALRESHPDNYQELQDLYIDTAIRTSVENNPYDAVAAITLIEDPRARAEKLTEVFAVLQTDLFDNIGAGANGATQNPTLQFVQLAQEAGVNNPDLQAAIDKSIAFDWAPERTRELQGKPAAEIAAAITGARDAQSGGVLGFFQNADVDESGAVEALWAANNSGNMRDVIAATGMSHTEILDMLKDQPDMQRMAGDMLGSSGYAIDGYDFEYDN